MTEQDGAGTIGAVWVPAARGRAVVRGAWWAVLAALTGACTVLLYGSLDFRPSPVTNRLVEYCIAVAGSPILVIALGSLFRTLQWLLLAVWPSPVGIRADGQRLTFALGPFRTRSFAASRLDVRYPFELIDEEEGSYEAYLPEEKQLSRFVPRLRYPGSDEQINRTLLRFAAGQEPDIAGALRPIFEQWRASRSAQAE